MPTHKRLWDYYDGEPFMQNPYLAVLNPKKRGKKMATAMQRKMAKVRAARGKGKKATSKRRGRKKSPTGQHTHWHQVKKHERRTNPRRRRNAFPMAGLIANPRRRHRRNPSLLGMSVDFKSIMYVGGGFLATPMVEGFVNRFIPAEIKANTIGKYAIKIGSVILLSFTAKMLLGADKAKLIAVGGGSYVLVSAINEFAPQITTMGSYHRSTSLGAYRSYGGQQLRAVTPWAGNASNSITGNSSQGIARFARPSRFTAR